MLLFVLVLDRSRVVHEIVSCSRYMRRVWKKRAEKPVASRVKRREILIRFAVFPFRFACQTGKGMTLEKKVALFCFLDEEGL